MTRTIVPGDVRRLDLILVLNIAGFYAYGKGPMIVLNIDHDIAYVGVSTLTVLMSPRIQTLYVYNDDSIELLERIEGGS